MQLLDLIPHRLTNQRLVGPPAGSVAELVAWQGAVQSQDVAGANWALGQRLTDTSESDVIAAFNRGEILRTHVLRPTWHYVTSADLRWLQLATAPRVHRLISYQLRQNDLTADDLARYTLLITEALSRYQVLTRAELFTVFQDAGYPAAGVRGAHVVMHAELECLIASGPLKGRQHTYMLLDQRAPLSAPITPDDALARLATRYFQSHGPATSRDLAWWSSLTVTEANHAISLARSSLIFVEVEGIKWYSGADSPPPSSLETPLVRLLPNYDEYFSRDSKLDRSDGPPADLAPSLLAAGRFDRNHLVVNGRLLGGWKRTLTAREITIELDPFMPFAPDVRAATEHQAERYAEFVNRPLNLIWKS